MDSIDENELMMVSHLDPELKNNAGAFLDSDSPAKLINPDSDASDLRNMFELQEFMENHHSEGKTTLAALKMIDLQSLDNASASSPHSDKPQATILVEYNPHEKQKRLGRPRRHLEGRNVPDPDTSSSENLEKLTVSKFRLDTLPVEGPGSRGGDPAHVRKRKGQVTESTTLKKRKQALLNFTKAGGSAHLGLLGETEEQSEAAAGEGEVDSAEAGEGEVESAEAEAEKKVDGHLNAIESEDTEGDSEAAVTATKDSGSNDAANVKEEAVPDQTEQVSSETKGSGEKSSTLARETPNPNGRARTAARKKAMDEAKAKKEEEEKLEQQEEQRKRPAPKKTKTKKAVAEKPVKVKKLTLNFKQPPSLTTVVRQKNRVTRTFPGPLVAIHFDLYDENVMTAAANKSTLAEELALGFPVQNSPYLPDIIYIILYLTKFRHLVDVGPIGPEDIERGLGLDVEDGFAKVSPLMDQLFRKLLALVLNRKKPILLSMQRSAIQELRSQYINLGLPDEWRDDTMARGVSNLPCDPDLDHVDPSKPKVEASENYEYLAPLEKLNPFLHQEFYEYGLQGILEPKDRLVTIRTLMVWSLSVSNLLKAHMVNVVNNQDVAGEKDTMYGSRAVLKGFSQTLDLKREIELKMTKKAKAQSKLSTPDPDSANRYIDPTSDPTIHPMSLRLNDFLVGDCGFHIGRFYLVRMADSSAGGLGSLEKMKLVVNDVAGVRSSIPSTFKLYVEDVYSVLKESLRVEGVEFDSEGNEVHSNESYDDSKHWYVVASKTEELSAFLDLVGKRLGLIPGEENIISLGSLAHKPLLHMYRYLSHLFPLLEEYERLNINGAGELRSSRKKKIDYAVQEEVEEEEYPGDFVQDEADDDDYDDGGAHEEFLDIDYA